MQGGVKAAEITFHLNGIDFCTMPLFNKPRDPRAEIWLDFDKFSNFRFQPSTLLIRYVVLRLLKERF